MAIDYDAFFTAISNAEGYYRTAQMIRETIKDGFEFQTKFAGPYATNMGFACELYLKSLCIYQNLGNVKEHNLSVLYEQLPSVDKESIKEKYNGYLDLEAGNLKKMTQLPTIDEFLLEQGSIFVKHRYLHEFPKNPMLYYTVLNALTNALSEVATNYWNTYNQDIVLEEQKNAH